MAAIPVQIVGEFVTADGGTTMKGTFTGDLSRTDLEVGGGPIFPPEGGPPVLPPDVEVPPPGSPPVILGDSTPVQPIVAPPFIIVNYPGIGKVLVPLPVPASTKRR
jgi:hypothetical protein